MTTEESKALHHHGSPVSQGRYATIVADPPWQYTSTRPTIRTGNSHASAEAHYPTMTNAEIAALPVGDLAADSAHLYMWVTNPKMFGDQRRREIGVSPIDIVRAWGFEYRTLLTWVKTAQYDGRPHRGGMGFYFRGATEHVMFATRGSAPIPTKLREPNVIMMPRGRHSAKPDELFRIAERVSPGPRLELFARSTRPGWDVWGNEVEPDIEVVTSEVAA